MATMEDPTVADQEAAVAADRAATNQVAVEAVDQVADPAPLGISREFSFEYGLGWVFQWVWTVFGLVS